MCKEMDSKNLILTLKAGLVVPRLGRLAYKKEDDRGFYLLLRIDIGGEEWSRSTYRRVDVPLVS